MIFIKLIRDDKEKRVLINIIRWVNWSSWYGNHYICMNKEKKTKELTTDFQKFISTNRLGSPPGDPGVEVIIQNSYKEASTFWAFAINELKSPCALLNNVVEVILWKRTRHQVSTLTDSPVGYIPNNIVEASIIMDSLRY